MPITKAFILAKNEEPNIGRSLDALTALGVETIVLDSGSTDRTIELASGYESVRVEPYVYKTHLAAYDEISLRRAHSNEFAIVLDADMIVTPELFREASTLSDDPAVGVIVAPITMCSEGHRLRHGSLCPPKPFAWRGGTSHFEAVGHAERVRAGVGVSLTRAALIHDDRKDYESYLKSQLRYGKSLIERGGASNLSWRDRLRVNSPLMVAATPIFSYFFRLGFLSGKPGLIYALDRLVAEAIQYRQIVASQLEEATRSNASPARSPTNPRRDDSAANDPAEPVSTVSGP